MTPSNTVQNDQPMSIRKVALAGTVKETIEWYDFFLYVTVSALVLSKISPRFLHRPRCVNAARLHGDLRSFIQ
jgi:hypothetical protein